MGEHMQAVTAVPEPERDPLGIDSLTAAETSIAERKAGQSITTLGDQKFPQAALLGALGWVMFRRNDVRMTFDAYMASRTLTDITRELGLSSAADADEDGAEGKDDAISTS